MNASPIPTSLRRRLVAGGGALMVRQLLVRIIQVGGTIALARILTPEDFGVFVTVSLFTTLIATVGDFGIAASMIQQHAEPSRRQLASAFTVQVAISMVAGALLLVAALVIAGPGGAPEGALLLALMTLALVVTGFRTIPTVLMERNLEFSRLAIAEVAQAAVYYATAIGLALATASAVSFGVAALAASVTALFLVYALRPWPPEIGFDGPAVRTMLRFGVPYQGSALVSFLKDALNPVFIGAIVGVGAVGLVNWAATTMTYPLQVLGILYRLYFPAFSRLRAAPERLLPIADAVIRWNVALATGSLVPFVLAAPYWTTVIFGPQWVPAVPTAYFIAATVPFAAAAGPGTAILNAYGRSGVVFAFTAVWMALTWVIGVPAILVLGEVGFGATSLLVTCTSPLFFSAVRQSVSVGIWPSIGSALLAAGLAWLGRFAILSVTAWSAGSWPVEGFLAAIEATIFVVSWAGLERRGLSRDLRLVRPPIQPPVEASGT